MIEDEPATTSATLERSFSVSSNNSNLSASMRSRLSIQARRKVREKGIVGCDDVSCIVRDPLSPDFIRDKRDFGSQAFDLWSKRDIAEFETVASMLPENQLTSCTIARFLTRRDCKEVEIALQLLRDADGTLLLPRRKETEASFLQSIQEQQKELSKLHQAPHHHAANDQPATEEAAAALRSELELRAPRVLLPWVPCYHPGRHCSSFSGKEDAGPDGTTPWCSCKRSGAWCEPGCGCEPDCIDRFKGCDCAKLGKECKAGADDGKGRPLQGCLCLYHMRECHPDLCAGHAEKPCKEMSFATDKVIRTFIGPSDLEGYGLFVGEDASLARVYIGEYRGELTNEDEAVERATLYGVTGRSYLFDVTKCGVVDGLRLGNKVSCPRADWVRQINVAATDRLVTSILLAKVERTAARERVSRLANRGLLRIRPLICRAGTQVNGECRLLVVSKLDGRSSLKKNDELLLGE